MKKLLALLLTLTMLCGTAITALAENKDYPQRFYDVPKDHWAFEYIAELVDRGVIAGYEDGSFKPSSTVTRAEFAKIMVCAASVPTTDNNVYFTDMQGHWAIPYVNAARNYLTAYSDNTYRPNQAAVREDVTMAMVKLKGYDVSNVDFSYLSGFTDTDSISNNVKAYVAVAVEKGLISGFEDNTFRGQGTLTRAEAATLLWKAFQYGNDNKVTDTSANQQSISQTTPIVTPQTTIPQTTPTQNTVVSTPTIAPIAEITQPIATEKPYKVDTLAKADVSYMHNNLPSQTAYNGTTLYYISDNKVYSLSENGSNSLVIDGDELGIADDFDKEEVTIDGICCGADNNLYAHVHYGEYPEIYHKVYVVKNGSVEFVSDLFEIPTMVLNDYALISDLGGTRLINSNGAETKVNMTVAMDAVEVNNNIIFATNDEGIYEYDYNTTTQIADTYGTVGLSNNGYVIEKDGKFIIRTFDGTNEIKFSLDDCAVNDKTSLKSSSIANRLFLTPNNNIIFYDTNAKAFRIISENK